MKKFLTLLTSVTLLTVFTVLPPAPAFAQIKITIPTQEELNDLRMDSMTQFLEDFDIVNKCLRRAGQEERELSSFQGVCMVLQVFDPEVTNQLEAWEKGKKLDLIAETSNRSAKLSGFEFLDLLFTTAGVTISPLSKTTYDEVFRKVRLRLNQEEQMILAIALENGLIAVPQTMEAARELRKSLSNTLKVREALAYLYQIASSEHDQTIINITPQEISTSSLALEDILKEVFNMIKTQSYFSENFDEEAAMEAAIKAAVKSLEEDKYIEYYTEEEFQSFTQNLNGNLEGIGAYIEEKEGQIMIVSPIEGSPAQKAGLLAGDVITHIDGESTEKLSLQEAVNKIRGPQGTSVKLTILRDGKSMEFTIVRNKITIPALTTSSENNIEIIKLIQFGNTSAQEMKAELESIKQKNPQGIIIDLRNNPGGFLNEVVTIVDYFINKDQPVVYLKDRHRQTSMNANMDPLVSNIPIAVLINKGSASASEILAGALQSYGIAKIYGETSFGKGTVQNIVSLQSHDQQGLSAFKFTTAEYLIGNPKGEPISIDGVGVVPDSNPGGSSLVDDLNTPQDEALQAVINDLASSGNRRR